MGPTGSAPLSSSAVLVALFGTIQVVVSVLLVAVILLHSGKGGGVSDMFGGAATQAGAGSTVVEGNLNRIALVLALVFAFNSLVLGLLWT